MTEFGQKISKISASMKGILKWFRMRNASEFLLCLLQRDFFELWRNRDNLGMEPNYFREIILQQHVIPFLHDPTMFLTQMKLYSFIIRHRVWRSMQHSIFWKMRGWSSRGNSIWCGNSPDMNPAENIGAIIRDYVEELMWSEDRQNRYSYDILKTNVENILKDLENDTDLSIDLLCLMEKKIWCSQSCWRRIYEFLNFVTSAYLWAFYIANKLEILWFTICFEEWYDSFFLDSKLYNLRRFYMGSKYLDNCLSTVYFN